VVSRPKDAANVEEANWRFAKPTNYQLIDNWFHVRRLLQCLDYYRQQSWCKEPDDLLEETEKELIMLLAIMENTTIDPLAWLPVFDHCLRSLWIKFDLSRLDSKRGPAPPPSPTASQSTNQSQFISQSDSQDVVMTGTQDSETETVEEDIMFKDYLLTARSVFDELSLWVDGCAINIVALRFRRTMSIYEQTPDHRSNDQFQWYRMLYERQPRCGDPECNRLLPSPEHMKEIKKLGKVFSIGTRRARVGSKRIREMISLNRLQAYPCLIEIIIICG